MPKHHLFSLLLLVISLTACQQNSAPEIVGLLEWERVTLRAEVSERIIAIDVKKGERVAKGQVILHLDAERLEARRAQAQALLEEAQAQLAEVRRGPRQEQITEAKARLRGAESDLQNAEHEYQRIDKLIKRGLSSEESLDNARAQRDRMRASRDAARAALALLQAGSTKEQIQQAEARVSQAQAQLLNAEIDLKKAVIHAPRDGLLDDVLYFVGEQPPVGATVAVELAGDLPYARIYMPEPLRVQAEVGTRAQIFVDGAAQPFNGHIRMLSTEPVFTPYFSLTQRDRSRLSYVAEVELEDSAAAKLAGGTPVRVELQLDQP